MAALGSSRSLTAGVSSRSSTWQVVRPAVASAPKRSSSVSSAGLAPSTPSRSVSTAAVAAPHSSLSVYRLQDLVSSRNDNWLPSCVPEIVSRLSPSTPSLHLVFATPQTRLATLAVSPSVASHPQEWGALARQIGSTFADGLVLVRPISSPTDYCPLASSYSSQQPASPSWSKDEKCDVHSSAASMEGRVGDCCDGEQHALSSSGRDQPEHHNHHSHQMHSHGAVSVNYYGLVVQSRSGHSNEDGCYVLKTSRTNDPTCSCTMYTLTHVCSGQPLYQQLRSSWLSSA